MSEDIVVEFDLVGKMYRLYKSRLQSFLDITSITNLIPRWSQGIDNFWALRNVSFKLKAGSRLGIVGRNGAGKTTLLKLMTGNIVPTEGRITVRGEVQALLEAGAGFHPEFTGYENIEASLTQNGLNRSEIKAAMEEIAEFTELGDFLGQPFKNYSAGMQARLVFTTATVVRPDILIVDEILGAGDGYFAVKSRGRMRDLVESGASVLLVSHALDQILQFCDEAIWLERGRIMLRGPSMEVVKAYEEFLHNLEDRRLKAGNRQRKLGFRNAVEVSHFADSFVVALALTGEAGARADISTVEFRCADVAEETLRIGDPQDADKGYLCHVAVAPNSWGEPSRDAERHYRSLILQADGENRLLGEMIFRSYGIDPAKAYSFRICYRADSNASLSIDISRNGAVVITDRRLPINGPGWHECDLELAFASNVQHTPAALFEDTSIERFLPESALVSFDNRQANQELMTSISVIAGESERATAMEIASEGDPEHRPSSNAETEKESQDADIRASVLPGNSAQPDKKVSIRRWPGEGSLLIEDVILQDTDGNERAIFRVGDDLSIKIVYRATRAGCFPIVYSVVIYRVDGVRVTQHVSPGELLEVKAGDLREVRLEFPSLDLADGRYVISVALHRELDPYHPDDKARYDLIDRSYDFEVTGNPPLRTSLFVLPAEWTRTRVAPIVS